VKFFAALSRILLSFIASVPLAMAAEPAVIKPMADDIPVVVKGKIGTANAFMKRIGLVATAAIPELIVRSTDLQQVGGSQIIRREQVVATHTGKFDLPPNTVKDLEIRIDGVTMPGKYEGKLFLLQPGQGATPSFEALLTVIAEGAPRLTPRKGSEALKIQLTDCWGLGCSFVRWVHPGGLVSNYTVQFDNGSFEDFQVTAVVTALGETSRTSLENVVRVTGSSKVPVGPVFTLPLTVIKADLPPDHYVGDVQLRAAVQDTLVRIPLELNVRSGPGVPLLLLVTGILIGRLLKYMKDKGGPQSDLLLRAYNLEHRVAGTPDASVLQPMVEEAKGAIYRIELDAARTELTAIENRLTILNNLRNLEKALRPIGNEETRKSIHEKIERVRQLIALKQDATVANLVKEIDLAVQNLATPTAREDGSAQAALDASMSARQTVEDTNPPKLRWPVRALAAATGIAGEYRATLTLWLLRPTMYCLLIVALGFVGLQQLYLKNATFGSDPLTDYFGLFVWAVSSDVASRTFSTLKSSSA
jgi:hypothetical protein